MVLSRAASRLRFGSIALDAIAASLLLDQLHGFLTPVPKHPQPSRRAFVCNPATYSVRGRSMSGTNETYLGKSYSQSLSFCLYQFQSGLFLSNST